MTLKAGLIGCGRIGADINPPGIGSSRLGSHAGAYAGSDRVTLVAACDSDESRLAEARRRWNIPRGYRTAGEMLERESLDIVSVCTPLADRAALIRTLIDSGRVRGILAEKPLAERVDEAAGLASRARQAGVMGAVNYVRRYAPGYRAVARDMRDGTLGSIQIVRAIYTKGVLNNGGHLLDLLRFFFGDPSSIEVLGSIDEQPGDPTVSCRLSFPAGFDAWISAARHSACAIFELDIVGTRERVVFGDLGHRLDRWRVDDTTAAHGFKQLSCAPETSDPGLRLAIAQAVDNLADCLEGGREPLCTFDDGKAALALALSVRDGALASAGLRS